jgi:hypothetical protein
MGTAGLNVKRLAGLLKRVKVDCTLVEGDEARDHCVLRISCVKCPGVEAFVEYENQGSEPRFAAMTVQPVGFGPWMDDSSVDWLKTLKLKGARRDDPEKLARWIKLEFLRAGSKMNEP